MHESPRVKGDMKLFAQEPLQAECYVVWWGLHHASQVAGNVLIKAYCREVVQALQDPGKASTHIATIVAEIRKLATSLDYFVCINVGRNQVAKSHSLAQQERKFL